MHEKDECEREFEKEGCEIECKNEECERECEKDKCEREFEKDEQYSVRHGNSNCEREEIISTCCRFF